MEGAILRHIIRVNGAEGTEDDFIALESRLRVRINGKDAFSLYCSPIMIKELVVGFIMTEGIINGNWCMETVSISNIGDEIVADVSSTEEPDLSGSTITSGCAGGRTFMSKKALSRIEDQFSISASKLSELYKRFQNISPLYRLTGCVHSAALSDGEEILCFAEDIGRHNAVDKVIGYALLEGLDFKGKIMLTSGRITSEVATKCLKWGIPILSSRAAPTELALRIATTGDMTLIGFIRGKRFNIYSAPQRIL